MNRPQYIPPRPGAWGYAPSGLPGDPTLAEWVARGGDAEQWHVAFGSTVAVAPETPMEKPPQLVGQESTATVTTTPASPPATGSSKALFVACLVGVVGLAGYVLVRETKGSHR